MFSLDQLSAFVAVAEELHFGRAAERLNMTQPPLSRQVQKLERAVGVRLLERDNRRVVLTEAGQAFLTEARRMLALVDTAGDLARRVDSGAAGTLRLGFTAVTAIRTLGPFLRQISDELPDVDVILHERVTPAQVDGLLHGELDLALGRPPFDTTLLDSRIVVRESLCAVLPADHRLAGLYRTLTAADFADEQVISYDPARAGYFHELTVRFLAGSQHRITQRVQQVLTVVLLVAAGRGVALVPESALDLGVPGVTYREIALPGEPVELHAIWRRDSTSPVLRRVLAMLSEHQ
ncbi:LysR family transcriptional regulator [Kribbella sandramycini]|uniref:DNA-binding transcriptional LysR family regulator n=1 Tax=Kribbella sandramycini TaxID=60450 RepID=A0A7Y4P1Q1_9ACTN|nr:LysR substrate-binding domain-containing protein [Kribbella sandramycini]MBB6570825.1 DNA-binding transcriptional LysR family regulator [Kribbella sandramycini]NOL43956.1 LysR family transcriptional regulator [Kribbella sandramycini]